MSTQSEDGKLVKLHNVPTDEYWKLKREKDESDHSTWTEFFIARMEELERLRNEVTSDD